MFQILHVTKSVVLKAHQKIRYCIVHLSFSSVSAICRHFSGQSFSKSSNMARMLRLCGNQSLCTHLAKNFTSKFFYQSVLFKMFSFDFHTNSIHTMFLLLKNKFRESLKKKSGFQSVLYFKHRSFIFILKTKLQLIFFVFDFSNLLSNFVNQK